MVAADIAVTTIPVDMVAAVAVTTAKAVNTFPTDTKHSKSSFGRIFFAPSVALYTYSGFRLQGQMTY